MVTRPARSHEDTCCRRFLTAPARCGERRVVQGEERLHSSRPMSIRAQPDDAQVRAEGTGELACRKWVEAAVVPPEVH
jgi:hypothetical protein